MLYQDQLKEDDCFLSLPDDIFISQIEVWLFCGRMALLKFWSSPDLPQRIVAKSLFAPSEMV